MATKKAVKKVVKGNGGAATKSVSKPKPSGETVARAAGAMSPAMPLQAATTVALPTPDPLRIAANEQFSIEEPTRVPNGQVQLLVNGQDKGMVSVAGRVLGEFVTQKATSAGVRNFSVYVDGAKVNRDAAVAKLDDPNHPITKIEIVSKDSRAGDDESLPEEPDDEEEEEEEVI